MRRPVAALDFMECGGLSPLWTLWFSTYRPFAILAQQHISDFDPVSAPFSARELLILPRLTRRIELAAWTDSMEGGILTNHPKRFGRLVARLSSFSGRQLKAAEGAVNRIARQGGRTKGVQGDQSGDGPPHSKDWPRSPVHRLYGKGAYIVTAGTLYKKHRFRDVASLDYLESELLRKAKAYDWHLEAWAVFSNHYHFVGQALKDAESLGPMLNHLHSETAARHNQQNATEGEKVWYNFWETKLTFDRSYQARLKYVHLNPVKHNLVAVANQYPWCSAAWFERTGTPAQVKTIYGFPIDKINVIDDFEPMCA